MGNKTNIIMVIIFLIIITYLLGIITPTGTGNILGIDVEIPFLNKDDETLQNIVHISSGRVFQIESFKSRQKIYKPEETAYVDFVIRNNYNIPFNMSVDWFLNDKRYYGWRNTSTELYNITDEYYSYNSWYPVKEKGDWKVQLIITGIYNNKILFDEKIESFEVI